MSSKNRKTNSGEYQHNYSFKEDSLLNANQRKPKGKEIITITAHQMFKVLGFILLVLLIHVISSCFSTNNSYKKPKNYDKTSRNFSIDGNTSKNSKPFTGLFLFS